MSDIAPRSDVAAPETAPTAPIEDVPESLAAYLVYLIRADLARWDTRRQLTPEDAAAFAARLAAHLSPELRARVEAMPVPRAAA